MPIPGQLSFFDVPEPPAPQPKPAPVHFKPDPPPVALPPDPDINRTAVVKYCRTCRESERMLFQAWRLESNGERETPIEKFARKHEALGHEVY